MLQAIAAQGFERNPAGVFALPENGRISLQIPASLIPRDPEDGRPVVPNLRVDDTFVEDEGWHRASAAYGSFLRQHEGKHILFFEIGVGGNTPVIIKYPFWQMTHGNPNAVYCCLNMGETLVPNEITDWAITISGDAFRVIQDLSV